MQFDPRTVAREIPGILDEVFPQLTPGVVARFNSSGTVLPVTPLRADLLEQSAVQRAVLFELGCVIGERFLLGATSVDWPACLSETVERQSKYFDVQLPVQLTSADEWLAQTVGVNLAGALKARSQAQGKVCVVRPRIPGLEWIASGNGDFALGSSLVEVKCTSKRFSASDYRQVAIYWLLSFAAGIEGRGSEWSELILLNPRSGVLVSLETDAFLSVVSGGRTKVDILQLFLSLVGSRLNR